MNTLSVTRAEDGNLKVTVHSTGERDLSAIISPDDLQSALVSAVEGEVPEPTAPDAPATDPEA